MSSFNVVSPPLNQSKRQKINSTIIEFVIQKCNSTQTAILQFTREQSFVISMKSCYISTLLDEFLSPESLDNDNKWTIYLTEEDPNEAAYFLTLLSKPMKLNIVWDKYFAILCAKWIVSEYIEKYFSILNDFLSYYQISDKNIKLNIYFEGIKSKDRYYTLQNDRYYEIKTENNNKNTENIENNNENNEIKNYFYKNEENLWCFCSENINNNNDNNNNDKTIFIQEDLDDKLISLHQLSGTWNTENKEYYEIFAIEKCYPLIRNNNHYYNNNNNNNNMKESKDLIEFCDLIEVILTHDCYHNEYINTMNDVYVYLSLNCNFATENVLKRLLKSNNNSNNNEIFDFLLYMIKNHK